MASLAFPLPNQEQSASKCSKKSKSGRHREVLIRPLGVTAIGEFAMCLRGANVATPANAVRVDLSVKYSRVLARVELGDDWDKAIAIQHQFRFRATGRMNAKTTIEPAVTRRRFNSASLLSLVMSAECYSFDSPPSHGRPDLSTFSSANTRNTRPTSAGHLPRQSLDFMN
jgi:hypothetical protein